MNASPILTVVLRFWLIIARMSGKLTIDRTLGSHGLLLQLLGERIALEAGVRLHPTICFDDLDRVLDAMRICVSSESG
jgi:hypothetical protein